VTGDSVSYFDLVDDWACCGSAIPGATLDDQQFVTRLSGHTAVQNAVALTLTALTIVGLLAVSTGIQPEATGPAALRGTLPSGNRS